MEFLSEMCVDCSTERLFGITMSILAGCVLVGLLCEGYGVIYFKKKKK